MPKGPAARNGDMHTCTAPLSSGTGTHVGGLISVAGVRTVFINNMQAAAQNDTCVCPDSPNFIAGGSVRVHINGLPAARSGDLTAHPGGQVSSGSPNVSIGD
ncbi:PAAR domain-containing protein [Spirosoma areae]